MLLCTDHSLSTEALEYSYKEILAVNFKVCYNRILEFETIQVSNKIQPDSSYFHPLGTPLPNDSFPRCLTLPLQK